MLSNFFYVFKFLLASILIGVIMILLGMKLNLGDVGIYIQPVLVGGGSALIVLGISRQFSIMKEDGYFDNFSLKNIFKKKNKKKVVKKAAKPSNPKVQSVNVKKEVIDKK